MQFTDIGSLLAVGGSAISVIGTLYNNLHLNHRRAMQIWMFSNIFLLLWAAGNMMGYWDGGISSGALMIMYGVFSITNFYGLYKINKLD